MPLLPSVTAANVLVVGASQGIGLEFVRQLLRAPRVVHLFATYRQVKTATALLALAEQYPNLHCVQMDLTDEAQISGDLIY